MKNIIVPILVLGGIGYLLYKNQKPKGKITDEQADKIVEEATKKVEKPFTAAFKKQYQVVMPPGQASMAVKEAAYKMQDDRKVREYTKMASKPPYFI